MPLLKLTLLPPSCCRAACLEAEVVLRELLLGHGGMLGGRREFELRVLFELSRLTVDLNTGRLLKPAPGFALAALAAATRGPCLLSGQTNVCSITLVPFFGF